MLHILSFRLSSLSFLFRLTTPGVAVAEPAKMALGEWGSYVAHSGRFTVVPECAVCALGRGASARCAERVKKKNLIYRIDTKSAVSTRSTSSYPMRCRRCLCVRDFSNCAHRSSLSPSPSLSRSPMFASRVVSSVWRCYLACRPEVTEARSEARSEAMRARP